MPEAVDRSPRAQFAELLGRDPVVADGGSAWAEGDPIASDEDLYASVELLAPGQLPTVAGYDVLDEVGRGGQGVVYRAVDRTSGETVAIKALPGGAFAPQHARARFVRETQILSHLRHPAVVAAMGSARTARGSLCILMPYVQGDPLDVAVTGLGDQAIAALFAAVADAVGVVHAAGVVHRDLKPGNVRVSDGHPRLLDFGLARGGGDGGDAARCVTRSIQLLGTLPYASPEQAMGDTAAIDARSDVYSLGVVLCRAIATGNAFPYQVTGNNYEVTTRIVRWRPEVPGRRAGDPLAAVALRCLAKDPRQRYPSAALLAADLRRVAAGRRPLGRAPRFRPRPSTLIRIGVAGVVTTIAVLVVAFWTAGRHPAARPQRYEVFTTSTTAVDLPRGDGNGGHVSVARTLATEGQVAVALRQAPPPDPSRIALVSLAVARAVCQAASARQTYGVRLPTAAELAAVGRLSPANVGDRGGVPPPAEWVDDNDGSRLVDQDARRPFRMAVEIAP